MPNLTLDAIGNEVTVQDPFPAEGSLVMKAIPGTSLERYVTWSQFQRIRTQLADHEAAGSLTYSVAKSDLDARADEGDLSGLPEIDLLDTGTTAFSVGGSPLTGLKITGVALHAGQTKAAVTLGDTSDANGYIDIEAVIPGAEGNDITVEFETGAGEAIDVTGTVITVTLNTGTSTYLSIETLIQGDADAAALVLATKGGTGATVCAVEPVTALEGGIGSGVALTVGGIAGAISEVKDDGTEITYGIDVSTLTASDTAVLILRSGSKVNRIAVPIVA